MPHTCSKTFIDFPFAHRQPNHKGHCALIHGHNWSFTFVFAADRLDANGFVIDFGSLGWLKQYLTDKFDHSLVLNATDPCLAYLLDSMINDMDAKHAAPLARIVTVPNCGAEGLAEFLYESVTNMLRQLTQGRVFLVSVTVHEDSKNSATYA